MPFLKTRSDFFKNIVTLVTGSSIAQLISVGLSPLFSRMYSPHEFGLLATFMSVLSALSVIACLRYEFAIIPSRDDREAESLLALCFRIAIYSAVFTLIGVFIFNMCGHAAMDLKWWLWFLPVMVLMNGFYQSLISWGNRYKSYKIISNYRIVSAVFTNLIILIAGFAGFISFGLLAGYVIGGFIALIFLYRSIQRKGNAFQVSQPPEKLKHVALKNSIFPKVNLWQAVAEMLLINGVIYLLTAFFTPAIVGLYGLTMRTLQAPFNLIGYAIGQVFYQQASEDYHAGKNIQHLVKKSMVRAGLISLPIVIVLIATGPSLFAFVFGEQWRQSGVFAQILAPWFLLDFIKTPLSQIPVLLGKQKQWFALSIVGNILMIAAMVYGGIYLGTVMGTIVCFSVVESAYLLFVLLWIVRISAAPRS